MDARSDPAPSPQGRSLGPRPRDGRFVVAHNGRRDGYQVAAALAERGLLERLVTDFYAPAPLASLAGFLARRRHAAVPWRRTESLLRSFVLQAGAMALRLPMDRVYALTDRLLARRAAAVARRTGSALLCYSSYVPARSDSAGSFVIDFEYHPHPAATMAILTRDHRLFPETARSFEAESRQFARTAANNAWQRADAVICASSMTRRSLELAGGDPAAIHVVPYGCDRSRTAAPRAPGACRFLFVGQGIQRKGLHHLIRAWQARPRTGATLTLVCYRTDPGIVSLIDSPDIRLVGRLSPAGLDAAYRSADVFIMPSLVEGFGLVYLEALAHGCHVVGTTNTGLPDLHLSDEAATLVDPGEIDRLDAAISALIRRKRDESLDPVAIAAEAQQRSWAEFRKGVADFAAGQLSAALAPHGS